MSEYKSMDKSLLYKGNYLISRERERERERDFQDKCTLKEKIGCCNNLDSKIWHSKFLIALPIRNVST